MRVGVVQYGTIGLETQGYGKAAAEWLYKSSVRVTFPEPQQNGHLPSLATGPLQGRSQGVGSGGRT